MATAKLDESLVHARSISSAASILLRRLQQGGADVEHAAERLELQAAIALDDGVAGFDGVDEDEADDEVLGRSLAQINIGLTLLAAEAALERPADVHRLGAAVGALDQTTSVLEGNAAGADHIQGFDTRPGGTLLSVDNAARGALDEMATLASTVASAMFDETLKPFIAKSPQPVRQLVEGLDVDLPGRLVSWGMRAVRRGFDLLLRVIDLDAIERARDRVDDVIQRLADGQSLPVLVGWAIGTEEAREVLSSGPDGVVDPADHERVVGEMATLAERFARLAKLLRRIVVVLTGLAGVLALLQITLPHATAITVAGLVVVVGALVVLGRDYTGVNDLPGRVRGVRLLVLDARQDAD